MKKITTTLLLFAALGIAALHAQQSEIPKQNPNGFYIGVQANSPLMWGDLFSLGKETRLGYGGGLFAGYTIGKWFSPELSFDYGVGRLGAQEHQLNDYFNKAGIIKYAQYDTSDMKLGNIYSKATYMQGGLRLQMSVLNLIRPGVYHPFDIEIAPTAYMQKFTPKLYAIADDKELAMGNGGGNWDFAVGGDLGLRFRFSPNVSAHLRGGLLWMNNEAFDGVSNDPLWRVNLMANASAGITFHLGKSKPVPIVATPPAVDDSAAVEAQRAASERAASERAASERAAREAEAKRQAELAAQREAEAKHQAYVQEEEDLQIPALFFRRGYSDINLKRYQSNLDEMVATAQKYADTQIAIEGWCDVTGSDAVNARLSQQRAEALRNYLISKGISESRFTSVQGMGVDREGGYDQIARRAMMKLSVK